MLLQQDDGFYLLHADTVKIVLFFCAVQRPGWGFELENAEAKVHLLNIDALISPAAIIKPIDEVLARRHLPSDMAVIKLDVTHDGAIFQNGARQIRIGLASGTRVVSSPCLLWPS